MSTKDEVELPSEEVIHYLYDLSKIITDKLNQDDEDETLRGLNED